MPRALAALILCLAALPAHGQSAQPKPILVLCATDAVRPPKAEALDMTYYLQRALQEAGTYQIVMLKPTDPAVKAAIDANKISATRIAPPVTQDAARNAADTLGAAALLMVSGWSTRDGVAGQADLETRVSQGRWSSTFSIGLQPYRSKNRKGALLEGINAHVTSIVTRITGAPPRTQQADPAETVAPTTPKPAGPGAAAPEATSPFEVLVGKYRRQGDLANLVVALRRAIDASPRDGHLRRDLIIALRERGDTQQAQAEAARAAAMVPGDGDIRRLMADALVDAGDFEGAIAAYAEAVKANPKDASARVAIGDAYWNSGKPAQSLEAYTAAAAISGAGALPYRRIARVHAHRRAFAESAAAMKAAGERTTDADADALEQDYASLLTICEGFMTDALTRVQQVRKEFVQGALNREGAFKEVGAQKTALTAIGDYVNAVAPPQGYVPAQALYAQAAALSAQACEAMLTFLETQEESDDKEATILRMEAQRQMTEAAKKLKSLTSRTARP
ncbi:MAG: tetratricopeptide repeat protein [Armatimonadetes bacterium]|nr:tetratricopeptide repeat protein [Armatimonadota bacterium]